MDYLEFTFDCSENTEVSEIVTAALSDIGFESFVEQEDALKAYIPIKNFNEKDFKEMFIWDLPNFKLKYSSNEIKAENWNKKWEESITPIEVDNCIVRASFHNPSDKEFEIVIDPKMAFGTGHHQTTRIMMRFILQSDIKNKSLCDMGTGSGILAILSEKKGAQIIQAYDIDNWAVESAKENLLINNCHKTKVEQGTEKNLPQTESFDYLLANINRNILLESTPYYQRCIKKGGVLIVSGFFKSDADMIIENYQKAGFVFKEEKSEENWCGLKFIKLI